ncbi:hypothetical protein LH442_14570 [Laribacter hongkongensis]|uniref:hypothetical protein n=1 Tax=Laribacter hongkongensis TaxID=168471 RepID=UPI001EFCC355|nr:hypothetical protein [Laribacter hongkongensis]MCG9057175.1 hypothetical protein [Laribacter hongkongensis]
MTKEQRKSIENGIWLCSNHSIEIDRDEVHYTGDILRQMKTAHESRVSAQLSGPSRLGASGDFLAIGTGIVASGELIGTTGLEWTLRLDHFLIGELADLIEFSEKFDQISLYDRFVLVNALGDGRQLALAPSWSRENGGFVVVCKVKESFPRISAHKLGRDIVFDFCLDNKGNIATVAGLDSLPQKIQTCLSTLRGEILYSPEFGSRLKEYFDDFNDSPWLARLFKLEVIRLACIPYFDSFLSQPYTPFQSVRRVRNVELAGARSGDLLPFRFQLDVEGVGDWQNEISIFVPLGTREPTV